MTSGPAGSASGPVHVSDEMAAHYRETMLAHADDPTTGACVRCQRTRCDEWRWAYERLVLAGRLGDLQKP
ncbi:hypothetical protein AB0J86_19685 [Micromonospora sp. NPDC049559]|uniref:hypothetical protein n=1 Tax=Micromonospora sp. NPDC049559 TaxID=3155923 RepID=UPI0034214112